MTTDPHAVANAFAAASLDGRWAEAAILNRLAATAGIKPKRLRRLAAAIVAAYRDPPVDRRRELAGFIAEQASFHALWREIGKPRVGRDANDRRPSLSTRCQFHGWVRNAGLSGRSTPCLTWPAGSS